MDQFPQIYLKLKKLELPCMECDHKSKYHHQVDFGTWHCLQCGGRCSYDGKTTFPTIHDIAN